MKPLPQMRTIPLRRRSLFNALFLLQHVPPLRPRLQPWRDAVRLRIADDLARGGPGKLLPVTRVRGLRPAEFRRRYLATGTPVVLEGAAAGWPCVRDWSFEAFRRRHGSVRFKLVQQKGLAETEAVDGREYSEEIEFGALLDQALNGGTKYLRFAPVLDAIPELVDDLDGAFLRAMQGRLSLGTTFEAFIGGADTFTPLHNEPTSFLFVNVCGVKRWRLIPNHYIAVLDPPADGRGYNYSGGTAGRRDPVDLPGFGSIDQLEAVLEPGDILFMPSWLWHSTRNETPSIAVRCGMIDPLGVVTQSPLLFAIRAFAARNPSVLQVLYYTVVRKNVQARTQMLMQPRLHWKHGARRRRAAAMPAPSGAAAERSRS